MASDLDKEDFFYPRYPYRGEVKPENLVFNANLQEFAHKITYICNLETAGKIKPQEAYYQIKDLWLHLQNTKDSLGIGENPFQNDENTES